LSRSGIQGLLGRKRDVQLREIRHARDLEHHRQRLDAGGAAVEIVQVVLAARAMVAYSLLVHRRCERTLDAGADEADEDFSRAAAPEVGSVCLMMFRRPCGFEPATGRRYVPNST
jgi:hypothetical protein